MITRDHMDPAFSRELEGVLKDLVDRQPDRVRTPSPILVDGRRRSFWVTAVVGLVVVLLAVLAIQGTGFSKRVAAPPTGGASPDSTLLQKLPTQKYGRIVHTWTSGDTASGPFDVTGKTVVIASVCRGGGAISVKAPGRPARKLSCTSLDVQQPGWKFNLGGDEKPTTETAPVHVTVTVTSGTPEYIVRMWAVDPRILSADIWSIAATSASVPESLRTCSAADLSPSGSFARLPDEQDGVITIASRSTTDCAIRSWPTASYLAANGTRIGAVTGGANGKSLDSREGKVNKYGEFPPARLTAGGRAYLIVDLFTEARLQRDDADMAAAQKTATPAPSPGPRFTVTPCDPQPVSTVRLEIGAATVTVPVPASAKAAACRSADQVFGVDPVVVERPTGK